MAFVAVDDSGNPQVESKISQKMLAEENENANNIKASESDLQPSHEEHIPAERSMCQEKITCTETLDKGYLKYGCAHYRRRRQVRAPCCDEIFDCRHCHNEVKVICSLCNTEQEVSKKQFHCDGCGICRMGGSKNFFHCDKCECCYSVLLKSSQPCVERAMHQDCPVCFEYLFESRKDVIAMPCGHTIHKTCLKEMREHYTYACPICSKSVYDMLKVWEKYDLEIAATPMPSYYEDKMVWILCNDCGSNSKVKYHIVGQKCPDCKSYNTRQTRGLGG